MKKIKYDEKLWINLNDSLKDFFYKGTLFRFKSEHLIGNSYRYAMGVFVDGSQNLSFFGLDGECWGAMKEGLPVESRFEGKLYTVSRTWLLQNFDWVCTDVDPSDIWYCDYFRPVPIKYLEDD